MRKIVIAVLLILLWPLPLRGEEGVKLRRHFQPGTSQSYAFLLSQRFEIPAEQAGKVKIQLVIKFMIVYKLTPVKVDDKGVTTLRWSYQRIYIYRWQAGMMLLYDTAKPRKDKDKPLIYLLNLILKPILEKDLTLKVDSRGRLLEVKGNEKILKKVLKSLPPAYKSFLKGTLRRLFSTPAIEGHWSHHHPSFPKRALKEGDQWKVEIELPRLGAKIEQEFTYRGQGHYKEGLYLVVEAKISYKPLDEPQGAGGYHFLSGQGRGKYYFDGRGRLIKVRLDSSLKVLQPADKIEFEGRETSKTWKTKYDPSKEKKRAKKSKEKK